MTLNVDFSPLPDTPKDFTNRFTESILHHNEHEELKADRKMMVEAMIVKIMKNQKLLTLPKLYTEITPKIEARGFQFNENFVSNTFRGLMNKNYIRDL